MQNSDSLVAQREMPRYKCHKEVWALKITDIQPVPPRSPEDEDDGAVMHLVVELPFFPVRVRADYMDKHMPEKGGYYVVYNDGYQSYSPAKAFEEGYSPVSSGTTRHPSVQSLMQFFTYGHLPVHLQAASKPFSELAEHIANGPQNTETTVALRKLLEAKDCAVRAKLMK